MYEGDSTPHSYRPIPLSKAQIRKMQRELREADKRIEDLRIREQREREHGIDTPSWL